MRAILLIFFLSVGHLSSAQVSTVRAKLNGSYGFSNYGELGMTLQFDHFFAVGAYVNTISDNLRVKNPTDQYIVNPQRNRGESVMLCAGVTSYAPEKIHFTGLAGISLGNFYVHENVQLYPLPSGNVKIVSNGIHRTLPGFSLRGEMTFALSRVFGFSGGVFGNVNPKFAYVRVYIGLAIGKLGAE